jgi:hypothetical protein
MSDVFTVKTQGDLARLELLPSTQDIRTVVVDGFIPRDILESGELYRIWTSSPGEVCMGVGESVSRIYSILLRALSPLSRIQPGAYATLHIRDTIFPPSFLVELGLATKVGTLRYETTRQAKGCRVSFKGVNHSLERLCMDYGSYLDCDGLNVESLVLYTLLCAGNIDKAERVKSLAIIHPFNIVPDGEITIPPADKFSRMQLNGFPFPAPPGLERIVVPESQEFRYLVKETYLPDVVGFIPSMTYPSRVAFGIKQARHPFEKSRLPDILMDMYLSPPETRE